MAASSCGEGKREALIKGYTVSLTQDEQILEIYSKAWCTHLILYHTLKIVLRQRFMMTFINTILVLGTLKKKKKRFERERERVQMSATGGIAEGENLRLPAEHRPGAPHGARVGVVREAAPKAGVGLALQGLRLMTLDHDLIQSQESITYGTEVSFLCF